MDPGCVMFQKRINKNSSTRLNVHTTGQVFLNFILIHFTDKNIKVSSQGSISFKIASHPTR